MSSLELARKFLRWRSVIDLKTRFLFSVMFISERFMTYAYDSNFGEKTDDHDSSHPVHELYQSTLTVIGTLWI